MNYYFNFFDKEKNEYSKVNSDNNSVKTNLSNFNLKIFYNELGFRYDKITDFKLHIERESNGVFYFYKKIDALVDEYEMSLNFNRVNLDVNEIKNEKYKIYLVLSENGMPVFTDEHNAIMLTLKTHCEDFYIDIKNTTKIDDVFEVQDSTENLTKIDFVIKTIEQNKTNNLLYYSKIDPSEDINIGQFNVLGTSEKSETLEVTPVSFINNETFVHVILKDTFGNLNHKKYKLLAFGNNFSSFEIYSDEIVFDTVDKVVNLYVDFRNVSEITPLITYKENGKNTKIISNLSIGTYNITEGLLSFSPKDYFDLQSIISLTNNMELSFMLNRNSNLETKPVAMMYDNRSPVVKISNLDENNYGLVKDEKEYFKINGTFMEDNLFFIGGENKKCDFLEMGHTLIVSSDEEVAYAEFQTDNGIVKTNFHKYGENYICKSFSEGFKVYDINGIEKTITSNVNDFVNVGYKKLYITLDQKKLSDYEKNIVENQQGLIIKGPLSLEILSQKFIKFNNYYLIEAVIVSEKSGYFQFDLGISEFNYSFLKYCLKDNISSDINDIKEISLNFEKTRIVSINTISDISLIKFNNFKKLGGCNFSKLKEMSFVLLSLDNEEFFSTNKTVSFFDDYLNSKTYEAIHAYPTLKDLNDVTIKYENFKMSKSSKTTEGIENNYSFEMDCPITNGINDFKLFFSDVNGKESITSFTIEKNKNEIEILLDFKSMTDSEISENESEINLTSNKNRSFVKMSIHNETKYQLESERYIVTKSGDKISKYKIINEKDYGICSFYLDNSIEGLKYEIFYGNLDDKKLDITAFEKSELTLYIESDFISGSNSYYIEFEKDEFSKLDFDHNNKDKFRCILNENYIEVVRLNNDNFLEEIEISVKVFDTNGIFGIKSKIIKGTFYNDSILVDYKITDQYIDEGYLISPIFDLEIKTYSSEHISYIYYQDNFETDIFKRKKIAYYDITKEAYVIKGIVAPIVESSLTINFNLKKDGLVIRKEIFTDDKIFLKTEENVFLTSCNKVENELEFVTKSVSGRVEVKEIEIYANDILKNKFENIIFENEFDNKIFKTNIDGLIGNNSFYMKFITKRNKVIYSKVFEFNFSKHNIDFKHYVNENVIIKDLESAKNLEIHFKEQSGAIKLEVTDLYGDKIEVVLKDGINILDFLSVGVYRFKMFFVDANNKRQLSDYKVQIFNNYGEHIELENNVFEKIKRVCSVMIKNNSVIQSKELGGTLSLYSNGNFIKSYYAEFQGEKMFFDIEKVEGKIDLFYNDKYSNVKIATFEHTSELNKKPIYFDIETKGDSMFSVEENVIRMIEFNDIYFKTKNVDFLKIINKKFGRITEKKVSDKFKTSISKVQMPCEIIFCDKNGNKIINDSLFISEQEKNVYKFKIPVKKIKTKEVKSKLTFKIQDYIVEPTSITHKVKLVHKFNHIMYSKFNSIARNNANIDFYKEWLKLDKNKINEIIKKINSDAYKKLISKKMETDNDSIKKEMIKIFEANKGGNKIG